MSSTEPLELGRILVDIPVKYRAIRELYIRDHANEYGSLSATLVLAEERRIMRRSGWKGRASASSRRREE